MHVSRCDGCPHISMHMCGLVYMWHGGMSVCAPLHAQVCVYVYVYVSMSQCVAAVPRVYVCDLGACVSMSVFLVKKETCGLDKHIQCYSGFGK